MNFLQLVTFGSLLVATSAEARSPHFTGSCQSSAEGGDALPFDLEITPGQSLSLPIVERDSFGNEVVTNVLVSFPLSSLLAVRFSTDLATPLNGDVSSFGVTTGTSLRVRFPLHLGGQVACEGSVRE